MCVWAKTERETFVVQWNCFVVSAHILRFPYLIEVRKCLNIDYIVNTVLNKSFSLNLRYTHFENTCRSRIIFAQQHPRSQRRYFMTNSKNKSKNMILHYVSLNIKVYLWKTIALRLANSILRALKVRGIVSCWSTSKRRCTKTFFVWFSLIKWS